MGSLVCRRARTSRAPRPSGTTSGRWPAGRRPRSGRRIRLRAHRPGAPGAEQSCPGPHPAWRSRDASSPPRFPEWAPRSQRPAPVSRRGEPGGGAEAAARPSRPRPARARRPPRGARAPCGPRALAPPRAAQLAAAEPSLLRPKLPRRAPRRRTDPQAGLARAERHTAGTGSRELRALSGSVGPTLLQTPGRPAIRGPHRSGAPSGGGSSSSDLRCWGLPACAETCC